MILQQSPSAETMCKTCVWIKCLVIYFINQMILHEWSEIGVATKRKMNIKLALLFISMKYTG